MSNRREGKILSSRQEKFAWYIATRTDMSQTEAAKRAGYNEKGAHVCGSNLMNVKIHPQVVERVEEIRKKMRDKMTITLEEHMDKLAEIRDAAFNADNFSAAVAAEKNRGLAGGFYIDRKEIVTGKMDQLTKAEVVEEIHKLQNEYPQLRVTEGKVINDEEEKK